MPALQVSVLLEFLEKNPDIENNAQLIQVLDDIPRGCLFLLCKELSYALETLESVIEANLPGRSEALFNACHLKPDEITKINLNKKEIFFNTIQKASVMLTSVAGIGLSVLAPFNVSGWSNVVANAANLLVAIIASIAISKQSYNSLKLETKAAIKNLSHKRIHHLILHYTHQMELAKLARCTDHALKALEELGYKWDAKILNKFSNELSFALTKQDLFHIQEGLSDYHRNLQHHVKEADHGEKNDVRLQRLISSTLPVKYYAEPVDFNAVTVRTPDPTLSLKKWLTTNSRHTTETAFLSTTGAVAGNFVFHGMLLGLKEGALNDFEFFATVTQFLDSPAGVASFLMGSLLIALLIGAGTLYNQYRNEARAYQVEKEKKKIKFDEENIVTVLNKTSQIDEVVECLREISPSIVKPFFKKNGDQPFFFSRGASTNVSANDDTSPSTTLSILVDQGRFSFPSSSNANTSSRFNVFSTDGAEEAKHSVNEPLLVKGFRPA